MSIVFQIFVEFKIKIHIPMDFNIAYPYAKRCIRIVGVRQLGTQNAMMCRCILMLFFAFQVEPTR